MGLALIVGATVVNQAPGRIATTATDAPARTAGPGEPSFAERIREGNRAQVAAWVDAALCAGECDPTEPLTMGATIDALQSMEAEITSSAQRRDELDALTGSICPGACPDRFVTRSELRLVLWRWLGAPGRPLIGAGYASSDAEIASAFFSQHLGEIPLDCTDTCAADRADLDASIAMLARRGFLESLRAQHPGPADLMAVSPFWTMPQWHPTDELCLDPEGDERYGFFDGRLCVSPELDADLRRSVAIHELAHVWQRWALAYRGNQLDVEADADCWAAIHGASWFNYVPTGCRDDEQRRQILTIYAQSLGLGA